MTTKFASFALGCLIVIATAGSTFAQQIADPAFNIVVEHPAYSKNYPRVLFDEAHNNFHLAAGRYKPFVDLITHDGYNVSANRLNFSKGTLSSFKVLVIANALGVEDMDDEGASLPAFTEAESDVVRDWVRAGGALLLIADHAPFGAAAQVLAKRFEVEMSKGFVFDPQNSEPDAPSLLIFSRENKLLGDHPIVQGRNESERINRVLTFTGQAMKGPANAVSILKLADTARDAPSHTSQESVSVAGQAQGLAFKFGKGRVVLLGEAAMLSAQIAGPDKFPMGMNVPGSDNRQFALNVMHWLSGLLK